MKAVSACGPDSKSCYQHDFSVFRFSALSQKTQKDPIGSFCVFCRGAENRTRSIWSQTRRTTGILRPELRNKIPCLHEYFFRNEGAEALLTAHDVLFTVYFSRRGEALLTALATRFFIQQQYPNIRLLKKPNTLSLNHIKDICPLSIHILNHPKLPCFALKI